MLEKIKEVLESTSNVDPSLVTPEANLRDDLGIDSLDSVEIIIALESEFNITIDDEEIKTLATVGDIIKLLESKLN